MPADLEANLGGTGLPAHGGRGSEPDGVGVARIPVSVDWEKEEASG